MPPPPPKNIKQNLFKIWQKLHVMCESVQAIHSSDGCRLHFTKVNKENKSGRKNHLVLCALHLFPQKLELLIYSKLNSPLSTSLFTAIEVWFFYGLLPLHFIDFIKITLGYSWMQFPLQYMGFTLTDEVQTT